MDASFGIGAGANLVGGTMQMIAASIAAQKMREQFLNEMQRQGAYRNQAFGALEGVLPQRGVEAARTSIAEGAANRRNFYGQVGAAPLAIGGGPSTRDRAAYSLAGANRAQLGGYSDWALDQMIKQIRLQDELNKVSNFAGGMAGVFPYLMYDAQHSQDKLAAAGNLISSIGGGAQGWSQLFGQPPQSTYGAQPYKFQPPPWAGAADNGGNAYD